MKKPKIATFDIESYNWINPICLSFYDGVNYDLFYSKKCIKEFIDFLLENEKYKKYKIYAHYGGRFDFLFILDELYKRDLLKYCDFILIDGNIAKLSYDNYNFIDSKHLLLNSLDKLTSVFKTSHRKLKGIDRDNILKYSPNTIKKYVKNDTIGLYEVLDLFYNEIYDIFNIYPYLTIASTTINAFQNQNTTNINPIVIDKIDTFIRNCYYGGRVEIFKLYGKNLYYYDFNSLYPSVMINNKFPVGNYVKIGDSDFEQYLKNDSKFLGYGKFKIKTPKDLYIPLLPTKFNNKLIFPLGQFIGYYSFNEIKKALQLNYEVELIKEKNEYLGYICKWDNTLFNNYILNLYKQKLNAKLNNDSAKYLIYKIMANSLYGKFGESKEREKYLFEINKDIIFNCKVYTENPPIYIYNEKVNKPYHNVGIAVETTTYARLKLYEQIEYILKKGYEIYYIDTDSIITNCPPSDIKTSDSDLGILKLETYKDSHGITHNLENFEGLFIAPKFYAININNFNLFKHKGFRNINLTFNELKELFIRNELYKINDNTISINKFKESLKRINTESRNSRFLSTKKVKKSIKSYYDKRLVFGNDTKPIRINNLNDSNYNFL